MAPLPGKALCCSSIAAPGDLSQREIRSSLSHWLTQLNRERLTQEFLLARLSRGDLDVMLRAIFALPRSRQLELPNLLYTLTEGNPFFVEEILKSLIAAGGIFYEDGTWDRRPLNELHVPRSLHDAVPVVCGLGNFAQSKAIVLCYL